MESTKLTRKGNQWNWTRFHKWKERHSAPKIKGEVLVDRKTKVFGFGSCFAENVIKYLSAKGVKASFFPGDTRFYDIQLVRQTLEHLLERPMYAEKDMWRTDQGKWGHPCRSPNKRYESLDALLAEDKIINEKAKSLFLEAEVIVITLGGTEIWRNPQTKLSYTTIPFPDVFNSQMPGIAEFHNLNFQENYDALEAIVTMTKKHNPRAKIIFTVSPNRMTFTATDKDVVQATCQGKSTLRTAVGEICEKYPEITRYFHSYELFEYNDYPQMVYDDQLRHVADFGVSVAMSEFHKYFASPDLHNEKEYLQIKAIMKDKELAYKIPQINKKKQNRDFKARAKRKIKKNIRAYGSYVKTVLVTGAARGIGKACADYFQSQNWKVVAIDLTPMAGNYSLKIQGDILSLIENGDLLKKLQADKINLDCIISNAAIQIEHSIQAATRDQWNSVLGINVLAPFFLVQKNTLFNESSVLCN